MQFKSFHWFSYQGLWPIIKFSASDNAILAFWLVQWISVTSHYTCVWPYIEMNVVNVVWQKLFRRKPSFVDKKKWMKKSRFGELSTEEIAEIIDNVVPVTTKKPQSLRLAYLMVRIRKVSLKSGKIIYDRRDFTRSWRLCNKNNVYLNRMAS